MVQKSYRPSADAMSAAEQACNYARTLIGKEAGGAGVEAAMHRLESKTGVGFWTWRSLWYRRPKEITHDLFERVRGAYLAICEREVAALQHDLEIEKMRRGEDADADLAAAAAALAARLKAARGGP